MNYTPDAYVSNYSSDRFASLIYGAASNADMQNALDLSLERNIGYTFVTDDPLVQNPWDNLPSYWNDEIKYIETMNPVPEPSTMLLLGVGMIAIVLRKLKIHRITFGASPLQSYPLYKS